MSVFASVGIANVEQRLYTSREVVETSSGNRIWRSSVLCGSDRLVVEGCTEVGADVLLRGDLAPIHIGRHCRIMQGARLRPATLNGRFLPLTIHSFCVIEQDAVVRAALVNECT